MKEKTDHVDFKFKNFGLLDTTEKTNKQDANWEKTLLRTICICQKISIQDVQELK